MKVIKPKPEQRIWAREFGALTGAKQVLSESWNTARFEFPCGAMAEWRWQDTTPEKAAHEARSAGFCDPCAHLAESEEPGEDLEPDPCQFCGGYYSDE